MYSNVYMYNVIGQRRSVIQSVLKSQRHGKPNKYNHKTKCNPSYNLNGFAATRAFSTT